MTTTPVDSDQSASVKLSLFISLNQFLTQAILMVKIYFTVANNLLKICPRKSIILYKFALNEIFSAQELSLLKNDVDRVVFVLCFFFIVVQTVSTGIFWVTTQILPMGNKNKGL